jgi:outer membrane lipoprotein-sorting protein
MKNKLWIWIAMPLLIAMQIADSDAFEQKDNRVSMKPQQDENKFHDFSTNIALTMKDANGHSSYYRMHLGVIEEKRGLQKKLFIVEAPRHLKGTALLIHAHEDRQNEQWLYLNSRRRVKRIHPCFQASKFLNSEWTYEDMGGQNNMKYSYRWVRDDIIEGISYSVFEVVAKKNPHSGYFRQLRWIEKDSEHVHKIEYYDRGNELLKTLMIDKYFRYSDKYWHIQEMNTVNHKTGKKMSIVFSKYRFDHRLDSKNFNKECYFNTKFDEIDGISLALE